VKKATSYRLTDEAIRLLNLIAKRLGVPQTAVLELLIREFAEKKGIE